MKRQVVCWAEVSPLSATTISTVGHLSASASPGLTDQLCNTTEHAEGVGVESACLAPIMNTFHFLHCGNRFFANDTSFPVSSINIQGQRGRVWVVRRRAWYNYSISTHSLCIYSLLLVTFPVTSEIKQRGKKENKVMCQGAWCRQKGERKMKR